MDEKYSREHEKIVLEEFDKIKEDFSAKKANREEEEKPLSLEDLFDDLNEAEDPDAGSAPAPAQSLRRQGRKSEAGSIPAAEKAASVFRGLQKSASGMFAKAKNNVSAGDAAQASGGGDRSEEGIDLMRIKQGFRFGRNTAKSRTKQKRFRINWKKFLRFAVIAAGVGAVAVGGITFMVIKDAPEINPDNIYDLLSENSVIYDTEGNIVDNVYSGEALGTILASQQLPKDLVDVFIPFEVKTFRHITGSTLSVFSERSGKVSQQEKESAEPARSLSSWQGICI